MGGPGSGRREYATTPTVEECRQLDIDKVKQLTEHPGSKGTVWWGEREDPDSWMGVHPEGERDFGDEIRAAKLRLKYTITNKRTDESTDCDYPVRLEYTECNYGGVRPWFRCPGAVDGEACHRRVRKLYLPHRRGTEYYLCRECYDLGYRSSRRSGNDLKQAELRYWRAFAKADAKNRRPHPNGEPWLPDRPKGMHYDTFDELMQEVWAANEEYERETMVQLRKLAKGTSVSLSPAFEE